MFRSKLRPIITPQAEHSKLAGVLAFLWGNTQFDLPSIARASFIAGIELHDRAYPPLDNDGIGEVSEERWMEITRVGFYQALADPVAEAIIKMHLRRLASYGNSPARLALLAELEAATDAYLQQQRLDKALFQRIDRITNLCDAIAFDFGFEQPTEGSVPIYPKNDSPESVAVRYRIEGETIQVTPWPFAVATYTGYILGYQAQGYPERLAPILRTYRLMPME